MDSLDRPFRIPPQYVHYANKNSIFDIQKYLLRRLIVSRPDDPIKFLIHLLKFETINRPSVFVLGPPCVGKHTVGRYIAHKFECIHITNNDLRNSVDKPQDPNRLGAALQTRLEKEDVEKRGYVITGFPETEEEAKALQNIGVFPEIVLKLMAPDTVIKDRATGKVIDGLTKEPYHKFYNPPPDTAIVKRLVSAADISPEVLERRLATFRHNFISLGQIYKDLIVQIPTDQPLADLYTQVINHLTRPNRSPGMWTPRVLLLGYSGSGRKSIAAALVNKYDLIQVHCGTLIRREVLRKSRLGEAMATYVEAHLAVPDEMVINLLQARLSELDCTLKGWILYGFPRSTVQAKLLDSVDLEPNRVMFLDITHNDAAVRLNARRFDSVTGEQYNLCNNPPPDKLLKQHGRIVRTPGMSECEICLKLTRQAAHREELKEYYGNRLQHVNADRNFDTVLENVDSVIIEKMPRHIHPRGK